jgi:hypothetical protein
LDSTALGISYECITHWLLTVISELSEVNLKNDPDKHLGSGKTMEDGDLTLPILAMASASVQARRTNSWIGVDAMGLLMSESDLVSSEAS